jgi:hypothetical protein
MRIKSNEQVAREPSVTFTPDASTSPSLASVHGYGDVSHHLLHLDPYDVKSKMTTRSSRASLPCPRLPVSSPPARKWQQDISFRVERQTSLSSSSSAAHIQRSVRGMKELMPLKLQSPPSTPRPRADLTSWLKNTISCTIPQIALPVSFGSPIFSGSEPDLTQEVVDEKVPWMSSQDDKTLHDLHPNRYRETPIYSEPRSPVLCRAYFTDEDLCFNCPPPGSVCDELCIVSDYEVEKSTDASNKLPLADGTESFVNELEESVMISPMSMASLRLSELSIKCRGESNTSTDTTGLGLLPRRKLAPAFEESNPYMAANEFTEQRFDVGWLDTDSSRPSSPDSLNEEFLDVSILTYCRFSIALANRSVGMCNTSRSSKSYHDRSP